MASLRKHSSTTICNSCIEFKIVSPKPCACPETCGVPRPRWINPLMGWTSTSDTSEQTRPSLTFHNAEEAAAFARKMGWEYQIETPNVRRTDRSKRFAGYGDNYRWAAVRPGARQMPDIPCICVDVAGGSHFSQYKISIART